MEKSVRIVAEQFVEFLNKAVTPYHVVEECSRLLRDAGFSELADGKQWKLKPGAKYFLTKNKSAIVAFAIGGGFVPGNAVNIVGCHTDSPSLRLKPVSKITSAGYAQVGVSTYGGGIWRTWFDRDLTIAGRVIVKEGSKFAHKLVHILHPILYIPNLAIHFDRHTNEKFEFNAEEHLRPFFATLNDEDLKKEGESEHEEAHHRSLMKELAATMGVHVSDIVDFDLCVVDAQPACIGGLRKEFVFGGRLDNLVSTYCAITALIKACDSGLDSSKEQAVRMVAAFDNEECGSESTQGAKTAWIQWILRQINADPSNTTAFEQSMANSFLFSADQAHATNPNYVSKYESNHQPKFHKGVVIKVNCNLRYATNAITTSMLKELAKMAKVPLQSFVVRTDSSCGTTVGPILAANLGIQTVDIGTPMLCMHSIREVADTTGLFYNQQLFKDCGIFPWVLSVEATLDKRTEGRSYKPNGATHFPPCIQND